MPAKRDLTDVQLKVLQDRARRRRAGETLKNSQTENRTRYWTDLLGEELRERLIAMVHAEYEAAR